MSAFSMLRISFAATTTLTERPRTPKEDKVASGSNVAVSRWTANVRPAPMLCATSTGRLSINPPSAKMCPSQRTGLKIPGNDIVDRNATDSEPCRNTNCFDVIRSVATQANGIGRSLKLSTSE